MSGTIYATPSTKSTRVEEAIVVDPKFTSYIFIHFYTFL
jgi:hypothetical protein